MGVALSRRVSRFVQRPILASATQSCGRNRPAPTCPEVCPEPALRSSLNRLPAAKSATCELDSGLIFDGCGLMTSFSLQAKSSDDAFSRHTKWYVARFRDMADHKAARKSGLDFHPKPEGDLFRKFSEQRSLPGLSVHPHQYYPSYMSCS
jgi:hypothetical protein